MGGRRECGMRAPPHGTSLRRVPSYSNVDVHRGRCWDPRTNPHRLKALQFVKGSRP
jgi:hypothetical protein